MAVVKSRDLARFPCGDVIAGSDGDLILPIGPAGHFEAATNMWFGWYGVEPGGRLANHTHEETQEGLYVMRGSGRALTEGQWVDVEAGDWIWNPPGTEHGMENTGTETCEVLWVYAPPKV